MQLPELSWEKFEDMFVLPNDKLSEVISWYEMWIEDWREWNLADYLTQNWLVSEDDIKQSVIFLWNSIRLFFVQWSYRWYEKYFDRLKLLVDLFNSRQNLENLIPEPRDYLLIELFKRMTNKQDVTWFFKAIVEAKATQEQVNKVLNDIIWENSVKRIVDDFQKRSAEILRGYWEMWPQMVINLWKNPYANIDDL